MAPISGGFSLRPDVLIHRQLEMREVKQRRHDTHSHGVNC